MKILTIMILAVSMLYASECKQYYKGDDLIRFKCDDRRLIIIWPEIAPDGFTKTIVNVSILSGREEGGLVAERYQFAKDGHGNECKSKYFYLREVYDEYDILMDRNTVCSSKSDYEPIEVWKRLKKENTLIRVEKKTEE